MAADAGVGVGKGEHLFIAGEIQTGVAMVEISVAAPHKARNISTF